MRLELGGLVRLDLRGLARLRMDWLGLRQRRKLLTDVLLKRMDDRETLRHAAFIRGELFLFGGKL